MIEEILKTVLADQPTNKVERLLDIGFRDVKELQELSNTLGKEGHIVGIDVNHESVKRAQDELEKGQYSNISVNYGSILDIPENNQTFDLILCKNMLHEIIDLKLAISEMSRVCRTDGYIVIIDFSRFSRLKFMIYKIKVRLAGLPDDDVHPGISKKQITEMLSEQELAERDYQILPMVWKMGFIKANPFLLVLKKTQQDAEKEEE